MVTFKVFLSEMSAIKNGTACLCNNINEGFYVYTEGWHFTSSVHINTLVSILKNKKTRTQYAQHDEFLSKYGYSSIKWQESS